MNFQMNIQKLWQYLNNKKTNTGAALLLLAVILQKMTEIWLGADHPVWVGNLVETLQWFGGLLSGVGLGHKGVKRFNKEQAI